MVYARLQDYRATGERRSRGRGANTGAPSALFGRCHSVGRASTESAGGWRETRPTGVGRDGDRQGRGRSRRQREAFSGHSLRVGGARDCLWPVRMTWVLPKHLFDRRRRRHCAKGGSLPRTAMSRRARIIEAREVIIAVSSASWHRHWSWELPGKSLQEGIGNNRGFPGSRSACAHRSRLPPSNNAVIGAYRDTHFQMGHDQTVRLIRSARRQSHSNSASSRRRTCWRRS